LYQKRGPQDKKKGGIEGGEINPEDGKREILFTDVRGGEKDRIQYKKKKRLQPRGEKQKERRGGGRGKGMWLLRMGKDVYRERTL